MRVLRSEEALEEGTTYIIDKSRTSREEYTSRTRWNSFRWQESKEKVFVNASMSHGLSSPYGIGPMRYTSNIGVGLAAPRRQIDSRLLQTDAPAITSYLACMRIKSLASARPT